MNINNNLFDLTSEQIEASKLIYNSKIIKCLVTPYHSYNQLEKNILYTETTYLFPEREVSLHQIKGFISTLVSSNIQDEIRIITSNQNIILDMIDSSIRILTEKGKIIDCTCKTFMSNIHDIRHKILKNEEHQLTKSERSLSKIKTYELIDKIKNFKNHKITKKVYDNLINEIEMIGESIISIQLKNMVHDKFTIV